MAHQHCAYSAASNGTQRNRRRSQPPQGTAPVFSVFPRHRVWPPAYQDFCLYEVYYHNRNYARPIMRRTRSNNGYQRRNSNSQTRDVLGIRGGGYVQEDETWVLNGTVQEAEDSTMMLGDDRLSEEVVSKYLKIRKGNHEVTGKDKEEEPEICVVCQDNLGQENYTIGVLDCGHEFHACCIKKWLQMKKICPLCKAAAVVCR